MVSGKHIDENTMLVEKLVEKPKPEFAPSLFGILGRYIFTPDLFDYQRNIVEGRGGEIQLTDAMQSLAKNSELYSWNFEGRRYDIGTMKDWFQSHLELSKDSEYSSVLIEVMENISENRMTK